MILISFYSVLAGLRPAGSHCENSGSSDGSGASARSGRAKQRSLLCPLSERRWRHPLFSRCLIFWCFWIKPKARKKESKRIFFFDRSFGKQSCPSDCASPARSGFTTFCHQKVAPKVSAERKTRGPADGLRLKRYADKLAPAFSTVHPPPVLLPAFSQCGAVVRFAQR